MSTAQQISKVNRTHLARELGLSREHISYVLSGKREPTITVAAAIARRVGITLDALYQHMQKQSTVN